MSENLVDWLQLTTIDDLVKAGLHESLTRVINTIHDIGGAVRRSYFDFDQEHVMEMLNGTLAQRGAVLTLWVIVVLLMVPFYMFTQRELAPREDQSVIFAVVQAAPNATIDQTKLFASGVYDVFHSIPESRNIFQITTPGGGFAGVVTKPWNERKKSRV